MFCMKGRKHIVYIAGGGLFIQDYSPAWTNETGTIESGNYNKFVENPQLQENNFLFPFTYSMEFERWVFDSVFFFEL